MNPAIKTHQINTYRVGDDCDVPDRARLRHVPSKLHTASLTEAEGSERLLLLFLSWSFVVKTVKGASLPRSRSEGHNEVPPSSHGARARSWEDQEIGLHAALISLLSPPSSVSRALAILTRGSFSTKVHDAHERPLPALHPILFAPRYRKRSLGLRPRPIFVAL